MHIFLLGENILISYKTCFQLFRRTFFSSQKTQARLTLRRFITMLIFSVLLLILLTLHWACFIIDEILFRAYKSIDIREPIFVVGVPRSGTTFLHRFLSEDKDRFTTFSLWELIIAPSITQRKIISGIAKIDDYAGGPLNRLVGFLERKAFGSLDDIHKISFSDPEEDYFLLAPVFACFIMILPFPFPEELGYLAFFDDKAAEKDKARIMAFYKTCLQRHLYVHGRDKQLLSKNVSFGPMIETINRTFPDCKIIGTVRDPIDAVPSHISSMMEGAAIFDNDVQGDTFRDQMVAVQEYAYTHLAEVIPKLPEKRRVIVKMEDLQDNLYGTVKDMYDRFELNMDPAFEAYLKHEDLKQKRYKSGHTYDLASFRLSGKNIYHWFQDVYSLYDYPIPAEG